MMAAGQLDDWTEAYFAAEDKSTEDATRAKAPAASVSRWRNSAKVQNTLQAYRKLFAEMQAAARLEGKAQAMEEREKDRQGESNRTETGTAARIDYYDPQNQRRTINAIIDRSQDDPKTQLDAIKAIQQTQRDDRQAAKDNQIQRFYLPLSCRSCPFYQKRTKKG